MTANALGLHCMMPWQRGQSLTWDVTVATTLANSYFDVQASRRHLQPVRQPRWPRPETATLSGASLVQPIVVDTQGPINKSAVDFQNNLCHRIALFSADDSTTLNCFAALQRNFVTSIRTLSLCSYFVFRFFMAFNLRDFYYRGYENIITIIVIISLEWPCPVWLSRFTLVLFY